MARAQRISFRGAACSISVAVWIIGRIGSLVYAERFAIFSLAIQILTWRCPRLPSTTWWPAGALSSAFDLGNFGMLRHFGSTARIHQRNEVESVATVKTCIALLISFALLTLPSREESAQ